MDDWNRRVVRVCNGNPFKGGAFVGTAFLINSTHLLTARHVVEGLTEQSLFLQGPAWTEVRKATVLKHSKRDIALLTLREITQDIGKVALNQAELHEGISLTLRGYTGLEDGLDFQPLPLKRYEGEYDRWALHTTVAPGNSGGPALLGDQLVGVIQARNEDKECSYIILVKAFKDDFLPDIFDHQDRNLPKPNHLAALVDKVPQWEVIERQVPFERKTPPSAKHAYAFVLAGMDQEWPNAVFIKLCKTVSLYDPERIPPLKPKYSLEKNASVSLWQALAPELGCDPDKKSVQQCLVQRPSSEVFWLKPPLSKPDDHHYLAELITAWESLELAGALVDHFLLIIYEAKKNSGLIDRIFGRDPLDRWINGMQSHLKNHHLQNRLLPKPTPPDVELATDWVDVNLTYLGTRKDDVRAKVMKLFKARPTIPHWELREHLIGFINDAHKQ